MSASAWGKVVDGTAAGPVEEVEVVDGTVRVELFWDDEEGVQLHIDSTDVFLSPSEWVRVHSVIDRMMAQPIPREATDA